MCASRDGSEALDQRREENSFISFGLGFLYHMFSHVISFNSHSYSLGMSVT